MLREHRPRALGRAGRGIPPSRRFLGGHAILGAGGASVWWSVLFVCVVQIGGALSWHSDLAGASGGWSVFHLVTRAGHPAPLGVPRRHIVGRAGWGAVDGILPRVGAGPRRGDVGRPVARRPARSRRQAVIFVQRIGGTVGATRTVARRDGSSALPHLCDRRTVVASHRLRRTASPVVQSDRARVCHRTGGIRIRARDRSLAPSRESALGRAGRPWHAVPHV